MTSAPAAAPRNPRRRTGRGSQRGQATVELALLLPVVCGLVLLVVQVAVAARAQLLLTTVVREAARAAAVDGSVAEAEAAGRAATDLDDARLELLVAGPRADGLLSIRARYRLPVGVPLLSLVRRELELSSTLAVRPEPG
jgi:hypothetical protein